MRRINEAGKDLIKKFEGLRLTPYQCQAGRWTVGYGHTDSAYVHENTKPITEHQADVILDSDLSRFEEWADTLTPQWLTPNQFSACVVLMFNIGIAEFASSTVLKKINAHDMTAAADAFRLFNKFTNPKTGLKEVSKGLVRRRDAERALFMTSEAPRPVQS